MVQSPLTGGGYRATKTKTGAATLAAVPLERTVTVDFSSWIVAIAARGDRAAFGRLFEHFAPRLKSFLMRQGADAASAEDLVQETMLSVWRKAALFDPARATASTWIFTIARNLRIDAIRKTIRPEFDPADPAFVPDSEPAADDVVTAEETATIIRSALAELPDEQAEVVRLSFFEDKAHGEIATQLALPLGTVKSRLRLAMKRIRSFLGDPQ
jgi:RNA polymerase sigma-70 factor (ECF subfamily)